MATLLSELPVLAPRVSARQLDRRRGALLATLLTPIALVIHGYHPYAEDGGLYLAGVKRLLHPDLYPHFTAFVLAPTRLSGFAPLVAALARLTGFTSGTGFDLLILILHLATIWLTLFASFCLACRCWVSSEARAGAVLLLACWLALPIAGTSLLFMDPYLTARSFSTPCAILALIGVLDATAAPFEFSPPPASSRKPWMPALLLAFGSLALAAVLHPLMAVYGALAAALLATFRIPARGPRLGALAAISGAVFAAFCLAAALAPPDSPAYSTVAFSRSYWFLSQWHWYELAGIVAPAIILCFYSRSRGEAGFEMARDPVPAANAFSAAAAYCAVLVSVAALIFARRSAPAHLVAALQPLRGLAFMYLAIMLSLGASLGAKVLRQRRWAWAVALPVLGGPLLALSHSAAPVSRHIALPGVPERNEWVQAFVWVRANTPLDALFALPADYISQPGEDAQCFRAIAERSALPDASKDGGEASVSPSLTPLWTLGQAAQASLATDSDQLRRTKLEPLGVSWLVLPAASPTGLDCPYANTAAKICRLK